MVKRCYIPFCKTGCKTNLNNEQKFSLFKAPSDKELLEKWREKVPIRERELNSQDRVCEKHFEKRYIKPRWQQSRFGDFYEDHIRQKLAPDAVPTIFPDLDPRGAPLKFRRPKTLNILQQIFHNLEVPEVEVNENDCVSVCYKCLIKKCNSHVIVNYEQMC